MPDNATQHPEKNAPGTSEKRSVRPIVELTPSDKPQAPVAVIKVIGVGGGGGNAVNNMYRENVEGVRFLVCNTDAKALAASPVPEHVQLGPGLGAGGRPERGRELAEENVDVIREALEDDLNMVFITAGMGGGTGTGAAPVIAHEAMAKGILTVGIVTIPFLFEQKLQVNKALDGVERISKEVDALLIVNNERLIEIYRDFTVKNAFKKADDTLTDAVRSIVEIINMGGSDSVNLDFSDVDTCLRKGGVAVMSTGVASGEDRLRKAIAAALESPLLNDRDIQDSKSLRLAVFSPDNPDHALKIDEMNHITEFMKDINDNVDFKYGLATDATLTDDQLRVIVLASGFRNVTAHLTDEEPAPPTEAEVERNHAADERLGKYYGREKGEHTRYTRFYVLKPEDLDNEVLIADVENVPTVRRTDTDLRRIRQDSSATEAVPEADAPTPEVDASASASPTSEAESALS